MRINTCDINNEKDPFHYRHRSFFVGLFVIFAFLVIPVFIFLTLTKGDLIQKKITLKAHFKPGEGVIEGSAVKIHGKTVGYVKAVTLKSRGFSEVEFTVKQDYLYLIKNDSIARLRQKNIVFGDWEIDISIGSESAPPVKDGDTLKGEVPLSLSSTFHKFNNIVDSLESLVDRVNKGEGLIGRLFAKDGIKDIEKKIDRKLQLLLKNLDETTNKLHHMIKKMSTFAEHGIDAMDSFLVTSLKADLLIIKTDTLVDHMDQLMNKMEIIPEDIQQLMKDLKKTLKETDILLKGMQNHWFLRRAVRKAREKEAKRKKQNWP